MAGICIIIALITPSHGEWTVSPRKDCRHGNRGKSSAGTWSVLGEGRWRKGRSSPDYLLRDTQNKTQRCGCAISAVISREWKTAKTNEKMAFIVFFLVIVNLFNLENGWLLKDYGPADDDYKYFSNNFKSHIFIVSTPADKMANEMKENASG